MTLNELKIKILNTKVIDVLLALNLIASIGIMLSIFVPPFQTNLLISSMQIFLTLVLPMNYTFLLSVKES